MLLINNRNHWKGGFSFVLFWLIFSLLTFLKSQIISAKHCSKELVINQSKLV